MLTGEPLRTVATGNREVTGPPQKIRLELRPSRIDLGGVGVFAVCDIRKREKIAEGRAQSDFESPIPWNDFEVYDNDVKRKIMAFCIGTPKGFLPPPNFDFNALSIEWYLNHSCEGNCGFDENGDFTAIRDIRKGEEISYDYGLGDSNPGFSMPCACGSASCRHTVTGNDWKDEGFRARQREHMHPYLRNLIR